MAMRSQLHDTEYDQEAFEKLVISASVLPADPFALEFKFLAGIYGGGAMLVPSSNDPTGYAVHGSLGTAVASSARHSQPYTCHLYPKCRKKFAARKSLTRHMTSKHSPDDLAKLVCPEGCEISFSRQDILIRHMKTQHSEEGLQERCWRCEKFVRFRSLPSHWGTSKCKKAGLPVPNYLDAVADPVLLSAWALIKLRPWGRNSGRLMDFATAPKTPIEVSIEYLNLRNQVTRLILHNLSCEPAVRDAALPDALAIMCVVDSITDGFAPGMVHARALVRLGFAQLTSWNSAQQWLESEPSVEALETATTKGVAPGSRETSQQIIKRLLKLLRRSTVEIMFMPFQHRHVRLWDRVNYLTHDDWVGNYAQDLQPILSLAQSIEHE